MVFAAGFAAGQSVVVRQTGNTPSSLRSQYLTGQDLSKPEGVDFSKFWTAWSLADTGYYGRNDKHDRVDGAIAGMLSSLKDPYTVYLPKEENELFQTDLGGSFSGIGAEISPISGFPTVVTPLPGSPAEQSGLQPKDIILKVDNTSTENENFAAVINRIRGEVGSVVTLLISREGAAEPLEVKVTRAKIEIPHVIGEIATAGDWRYCYVRVSQFIEGTAAKTGAELGKCQKQGVNSAVLDLRNNPGGLLDMATELGGLLIDTSLKPELESAMVWQKDRDNNQRPYKAKNSSAYANIKLVVLVNGGSASAAEILAGALQDYGRAPLVGVKTFGKGSIQELKDLPDGSSIKLTVAKWLTPAKHEIDHQGVEPDIEVAVPEDQDSASGQDVQRERAVEALKSL